MSLNPYQQYRATKVETAGSVDLVVMLYQGAVRFIRPILPATARYLDAAGVVHEITIMRTR